MSDWSSAFNDHFAATDTKAGAKAPATLGEIWKSEWEASGLDTATGVGKPMADAWDELAGAVKTMTGKTVPELARETGLPFRTGGYEQMAGDVRAMTANLDQAKRESIEPLLDIRGRARLKAADIEKQQQEVSDRTYGLSGGTVSFLAGMSRQMVDPINVATLPLGAGRGLGVMKMLRTEAGWNFAAQAAQEPLIQSERGELGLEAGFAEGLTNSLEAGAGAAGLAGLFRAGGWAIGKAMGSRQSAVVPMPAAAPEVHPAGFTVAKAPLDPETRVAMSGLNEGDFAAAALHAERNQLVDVMSPDRTHEGTLAHVERVDLAARALEDGRSDALAAAMREPLPSRAPLGLEVPNLAPHRVATADGLSVDVAPRVMELRDLVASNDAGYDPGLQPRDRDRAASQTQIREMSSRLDPERLGLSAEADRGAPIIGPDRMVESGNGRVMAIRAAYAEGGEAATRYRDWIAAQGVDVSGFDQPVIVRERTTMMTPEDRRGFTVAANRSSLLAMSAPERALADSRIVDPPLLALIRNADDLGAVANSDFMREFVRRLPQAEQGALMDGTGRVSSEGVMRARNALLGAAYGDARLLSRISEATNDEIKSISNALLAAAPHWAALKADILAGRVPPEFDLTPELLEAVQRTAELRHSGQKLDTYLAQADLIEPINFHVRNFMGMFYDNAERRAAGAERMTAAVRWLTEEGRKVTTEKGLDLGLKPITPEDLSHAALQKHYAREKSLPDDGRNLFGGRSGNGPDDAARGRDVSGQAADRPRPDTGERGDGQAQRDPQGQPSVEPRPVTIGDLLKDPEAKARLADVERLLGDGDAEIYVTGPDGNPVKTTARAALAEIEKDATAANELKACLGQGSLL